MEKYIIPRNIKVKETLVYGLNGKQVLYIIIGVAGTLIVWSIGMPLPVDVKIAGTVASLAGSLMLSMSKVRGQELDKYVINSIKYPMRQKEFGGENNEKVICNLRYNLQ